MSDQEQDRIKAAELFVMARKLEAERDYRKARESYEESLRLCEDETVRAAYLKLLATIGPL
jgi:hypothetical protein